MSQNVNDWVTALSKHIGKCFKNEAPRMICFAFSKSLTKQSNIWIDLLESLSVLCIHGYMAWGDFSISWEAQWYMI